MKSFSEGTEMKPGTITLTIKGGICKYKIYGYAIEAERDGVPYVTLQPADCRFNPVASFRKDMIASLTCEF